MPAKDPAALTSRIVSLLEDGGERLRLGRNGRALIEERNNWATEMGRMTDYYSDLIKRARSQEKPRRAGGPHGA